MRKFVISLAAAGAALAFATPAAAQYYPGPQPYGYGYGLNNYGQVRSLQYRIDRVQRLINRLDNRDRIGEREARRLRNESRNIERRLYAASRYGLNPYEANDINRRITILEQRVQFAANNGWRRYGSRYGWNGYNGGYYADRDRDGRDDRYENDHGWDHDD